MKQLPLLLCLGLPGWAAADEGATGERRPADEQPTTDAQAAAGRIGEDYEAGWERTGYQRVRLSRVARPLTTPRRTFDVFIAAEVKTPSDTLQRFLQLPIGERTDAARLGLRYGVLYGITHDWEISVLFPPMEFVNGVEFSGPVIESTWRLHEDDAWSLGVALNSVLPIANDLGVGARVLLRARLAPTLRLDAVPGFEVVLAERETFANAGLPVSLTVQLAEPLAATAALGVSTLGFETVAMSAGVEVAYTIAGAHSAFADLALGFAFPTLIDGTGRGTFIETSHWTATVSARFFVNLPADRLGAP